MAYSVPFVACNFALDSIPLCSYHGCIKVSSLRNFLTRPLFLAWNHTVVRGANLLPEKTRLPLAALLVITVIFIGTFASPQSSDNDLRNRGISIAGLAIFYVVLYATSANRKAIVWRTVLVGLLCQYILALFVLRTSVGYDIFDFISFLARQHQV